MKGMSTNVSRAFNHLDLPLAINHAKGKPTTTSINETKRAISKDAETAAKALDWRLGFSKTCPT